MFIYYFMVVVVMVVVVTVVLVVVTIFPRKIVSRGVLFVVLVSKNYVCVLSKKFVSLFVRGRKDGRERRGGGVGV